MEKSKIFKGESVQKALDDGLTELGLTLADVEYEILDEGKKGFLWGIGRKEAQVKITYTTDEKEEGLPRAKSEKPAKEIVGEVRKDVKKKAERPEKAKEPEKKVAHEAQTSEGGEEQRAAEFINELLPRLGIEGKAAISDGDEPCVNIETPTPYRIVGASSDRRSAKRGDVLEAIQSLAGAYANKGNDKYKKVLVDCGGYRAKRRAYLERLAGDLEKFAVERNKKVIAEPMSAYERRIIHTTLSKSDKVTTKSEGKEPDRYVVVIPNGVSSEERGIYFRPRDNSQNRRPSGHGGGGQKREFNRDKQMRSRSGEGGRDSRGPARSSSSRGKKEMHFNSVFLGNSGNSGDEDK